MTTRAAQILQTRSRRALRALSALRALRALRALSALLTLRARRALRALPALLTLPCLSGCNQIQSTLTAFGAQADAIRTLTIVMVAAAAVITVAVLLLAWHAVRTDEGLGYRGGIRVILWLGGVVPTVLLTALLAASLPLMNPIEAEDDALTIVVDGEQFWWRVSYAGPDGTIVTANEIRLPVGRPVTFALRSPDVIHSFWIPGLAGKVDMIPGRTNELVALATRPGEFRGVCAEFCGLSHAHMAFDVIAMEPGAFDAWLTSLAEPSATEAEPAGRQLFAEYGCAGCHAVRGHFAGTAIGPDLTQFGARRSVGAGTLPMEAGSVAHFIRAAPSIKPGTRMPAFATMPPADAQAIAAWLLELGE